MDVRTTSDDLSIDFFCSQAPTLQETCATSKKELIIVPALSSSDREVGIGDRSGRPV